MKAIMRANIISIIFVIAGLLANTGLSNNVTFANQDFGAQDTNAHTRIVQFDISWENSWYQVIPPSVEYFIIIQAAS